MRWQDLNLEIAACVPNHCALAEKRPILFIDSRQQLLYRVEFNQTDNRCYPVSTAANGIGNQAESNRTPFGIHQVRQKIGDDQPMGMIFSAREPTGEIAHNLDNRERDEITSRILWLDGLEQGVNRDGSQDTYARYIYIHGTSDEKRIGTAVSAGCVRMLNTDVVQLYDEVQINDLVIIR